MIVRHDVNDLLLITQPDHAALSGRLMAAWCGEGFPGRSTRDVVLLATREHDNGWLEPDRAPEIDPASRRPYDFVHAPARLKRAVWPRALARLAPMSAYAAALVAQHALTVYRRHRADADWQEFFRDLTARRDALVGAAHRARATDRGAFTRDYAIVYLGDLLSLIFCNGWTEPFEAEGRRIRLEGNTLRVAPDPFLGATVALTVPARRIPNRDYESDEDLRTAFARAPEEVVEGFAAGDLHDPGLR